MVNGEVKAAFVYIAFTDFFILTSLVRYSVKNTVWRCIFCSIDHLAD